MNVIFAVKGQIGLVGQIITLKHHMHDNSGPNDLNHMMTQTDSNWRHYCSQISLVLQIQTSVRSHVCNTRVPVSRVSWQTSVEASGAFNVISSDSFKLSRHLRMTGVAPRVLTRHCNIWLSRRWGRALSSFSLLLNIKITLF